MRALLGVALVAFGAAAFADEPAQPPATTTTETPSKKGATYSGGDGTSQEKAVVVTAPNSRCTSTSAVSCTTT